MITAGEQEEKSSCFQPPKHVADKEGMKLKVFIDKDQSLQPESTQVLCWRHQYLLATSSQAWRQIILKKKLVVDTATKSARCEAVIELAKEKERLSSSDKDSQISSEKQNCNIKFVIVGHTTM